MAPLPALTPHTILSAAWLVCSVLSCSILGCSSTPEAEDRPQDKAVLTEVGAKRTFSFQTLDGRPVSSGDYRGRMTIIVLGATYDTPSQAQARFVNAVVLHHAPRVNALLLILEPTENLPLAQAFADSLDLRYDVAMADAATIAGKGAFPGLHHVPSVVVLDREGREVWRKLGLINDKAIRAALRSAE